MTNTTSNQQCTERYPVPGPRSEPAEANITYRCGLKAGHRGPHGPIGSGAPEDFVPKTAAEVLTDIDAGFARMPIRSEGVHWLRAAEWDLIRPLLIAPAVETTEKPASDPPWDLDPENPKNQCIPPDGAPLTLRDFGFAPGNYSCRCFSCEREFIGDKRAIQCERCATEKLARSQVKSTVTICPTCQTELAFEGDICGLCQVAR
jgi:hypothetical protein